jgi:molybdopterin/thiamine biosynthesis adenylyltransferase
MLFPAPRRKVRSAAGCLNGLILRLKAKPVSQAVAQRQITAFCASGDVVRASNHVNEARFTVNANPRSVFLHHWLIAGREPQLKVTKV